MHPNDIKIAHHIPSHPKNWQKHSEEVIFLISNNFFLVKQSTKRNYTKKNDGRCKTFPQKY